MELLAMSTPGFSYNYSWHIMEEQTQKSRYKRSRDVVEEFEDCELTLQPKRFMSEEQMMTHLEHLQLTTPPYNVEEDACTDMPSDWVLENWTEQAPPISNWYYTASELLPTQYSLTGEDFPTNYDVIDNDESSNEGAEIPPTQNDKWNVILEDLSDSDSSDNSPPTQVWIAPEVKDLLDTTEKQPILPTELVKEMNKSCTALVPYVKPSNQIEQMVWKCHISKQVQELKESTAYIESENEKSDTKYTSKYEDDDEMEL